MTPHSEQESNSKNAVVCPESSIESANRRNSLQKPIAKQSANNKLACESTIESSLRRDFLRKASIVTAAGVAGVLAAQPLGAGSVIRRSEAHCGESLIIGQANVGYTCASAKTTSLTAYVCGYAFQVTNCSGPFGKVLAGAILGCAQTGTAGAGIVGRNVNGAGVLGCSSSGPGVSGCSSSGPGVRGFSGSGPGVLAESGGLLVAKFAKREESSDNTALIQLETGDSTPIDWNVGVGGVGNGLGLTCGQFYVEQAGVGARIVMDRGGKMNVDGSIHAASDMALGTSIAVDTLDYCNGNPCAFCTLNFGEIFFGPGSGERIGSQRNNNTYTCNIIPCSPICYPPGKNLYGLDFYTGFKKRMSITNSGNVGIGTCTPSSSLCVIGSVPNIGRFKNVGTSGDRTALVQFETGPSCKLIDWSAGVAGLCNACKIPKGSFYLGQPTKPRMVVNTSGQVGIGTTTPLTPLQVNGTASASKLGLGTTSPKTTLQVNGSLAARVLSVSGTSTIKSYQMIASDFAVLANASALPSGVTTFTVTLPTAATASGMIVLIKKVDGSTHTVTLSANTGDSIEGKSTEILTKQFDSLQLISNGGHEWFIVGNSIGHAFTS